MIKGIEHMYVIDQSKLHESRTFSSLRNLQNLFSSKGLVKISASWFGANVVHIDISLLLVVSQEVMLDVFMLSAVVLKRPDPLGLKCDTITSPRRLVTTFLTLNSTEFG
jgi:hypothetical protein